MKQKENEKINKDLNQFVLKTIKKAIRKYAKKHGLILDENRFAEVNVNSITVTVSTDPLGYPSSVQEEERLLEILLKRKEFRFNPSGQADAEDLFG
jgi:hypothetical protein